MDDMPIPVPPRQQPPKPPQQQPQSQVPAAAQAPKETWLDKLQALDEPMKGRVLIGTSALLMVGIVYIWMGYFNNIVMNNPSELANQSAVAQANGVNGGANGTALTGIAITNTSGASGAPVAPGFWQEMGGALSSLYHGTIQGVEGGVASIDSSLHASKEYTITPGGAAAGPTPDASQ